LPSDKRSLYGFAYYVQVTKDVRLSDLAQFHRIRDQEPAFGRYHFANVA